MRWAILLVAVIPTVARAHGGGLDANGCHRDRRHGNYHCHQGVFAGSAFSSKAGMLQRLEELKNMPPRSLTGEIDGACGIKRYCKQMLTCEEAMHYLNDCGLSRLDRDGDGIPCESLCR